MNALVAEGFFDRNIETSNIIMFGFCIVCPVFVVYTSIYRIEKSFEPYLLVKFGIFYKWTVGE